MKYRFKYNELCNKELNNQSGNEIHNPLENTVKRKTRYKHNLRIGNMKNEIDNKTNNLLMSSTHIKKQTQKLQKCAKSITILTKEVESMMETLLNQKHEIDLKNDERFVLLKERNNCELTHKKQINYLTNQISLIRTNLIKQNNRESNSATEQDLKISIQDLKEEENRIKENIKSLSQKTEDETIENFNKKSFRNEEEEFEQKNSFLMERMREFSQKETELISKEQITGEKMKAIQLLEKNVLERERNVQLKSEQLNVKENDIISKLKILENEREKLKSNADNFEKEQNKYLKEKIQFKKENECFKLLKSELKSKENSLEQKSKSLIERQNEFKKKNEEIILLQNECSKRELDIKFRENEYQLKQKQNLNKSDFQIKREYFEDNSIEQKSIICQTNLNENNHESSKVEINKKFEPKQIIDFTSNVIAISKKMLHCLKSESFYEETDDFLNQITHLVDQFRY